MRMIVIVAAFLIAFGSAAAQNKTIVLVRHAEKAGEMAMDRTGDPDLSTEGQARALRLLQIVKKYKPHEIFATTYKRTQQTAAPIAAYRHKQVQTYDTREQAKLVDQILTSKTEHYLIIGHGNSIPELANLLMKKDVFKQVPDTEYGVVWVVKIRDGKFKRVEVYEY
jgi:broad specificity phosphatase PhoE